MYLHNVDAQKAKIYVKIVLASSKILNKIMNVSFRYNQRGGKPDIIKICREENGTYQTIQSQILSESEKKQEWVSALSTRKLCTKLNQLLKCKQGTT
jgi:hypothetical protein